MCMEHLKFLHKDFGDLMHKGKWVILPAADVAHLPGLRISPPRIIPQCNCRPH